MKQSGKTILFVLVCIGVLVAAFGIGTWIKKIRFSEVKKESDTAAVAEKSPSELESGRASARQMPGSGGMDGGDLSPEQRTALADQRSGMRERFENMTDEEKEKFKTQMRDRFGGRRRDMGPQLSEEDRAKMREEIEALMARSDEMSDEEREQARNQINEKYGITPRGFGPGRGFGDGESGRRSPTMRPDAGQLENN